MKKELQIPVFAIGGITINKINSLQASESRWNCRDVRNFFKRRSIRINKTILRGDKTVKTNYEVAVIGGGIIGCSIAYYLAKEKIDVAIFEGQQIGGKSTSAAAGMLGAHSECDEDLEVFFPFARSSQLAYSVLKEEIKELSGIDIE